MNPTEAIAKNAATKPTATGHATKPAATGGATKPAATNDATKPAATGDATKPAATNDATNAAVTNDAKNAAVTNDAIYEVFAQHAQDGETVLVGSVRAPDATLALQFAREIYYRRARCERLAVVLRTDITWHEEAELTERNRNRAYRTPAYFVRARRERQSRHPELVEALPRHPELVEAFPRHPELVEGRPRPAELVEAQPPSDNAATAANAGATRAIR